ncbi:hypothetical protein [uncultured Desulfosarcina sp.]|uniref:hypothetical protein n=1 Tax=uncultured Desulfosarcina sp. TaxID=218289 RepID=UPI0029C82D02|nr:hypothetical protein [uncultured Desulfosarcina sp.]
MKFYFGAALIEFDPAMPVFGGIGVRLNFRIYGKRYWAFKRRVRKMKARMAHNQIKAA